MAELIKVLRRPAPTGRVKSLFRRWPVFLAFFLALSARADMQFDVFLGYDGIIPEATWFPVVCEIRNDGPPFVGTVEVEGATFDSGETVRCPVELPTDTLKRIVIPVFSRTRYGGSWSVRLLDDRRHVRSEQTVQPRKQISRDTTLIGGLARTAGGSPTLRPTQNNQTENQPNSARFLTSIFPDNPLVLEGLTALYLNSEEVSKLRPTQANAILGWLNAGGHLIVGVEQVSDISAAPWLQEIMPCDLGELKTVTRHSEIEDWLRTPVTEAPRSGGRVMHPRGAAPVAVDNPFADMPDDSTFELADLQVFEATNHDGRVELAVDGAPLIITANRGLGLVTVLTFSPEREPFRSWKNLPTFWTRLAGVPGRIYAPPAPNAPVNNYNYNYSGLGADGIFGAMIDSRQVHKLPAGWLLLLLLVYLVVIGPLDHYWLKRIRRPMLTWITFPCYVVFFSLLIYFIGYKLRAGESEWNELHVVDVLPNGDHAELRGTTYASLYSPANQRYRAKGPQQFATIRGEYYGSAYGSQGGDRLDVVQEGDHFQADLFVPVWTSQLFVSDWWQSSPLPFEVTVTPQSDGWQVTVNNHTDRSLTHARLVLGDQTVVDVGDFPANQSRTVSVSQSRSTPLEVFVAGQSAGFQQAVQSRRNALGNSARGQLDNLPDASMAASFVSLAGRDGQYRMFTASPGLDIARTVEHGGTVLLAWADDYTPAQPINQFTPRRIHHSTLWRMPVTLTSKP